jgi:hypothetical protein
MVGICSPVRLERAAADENAVGLLRQRHVGAAGVAGHEGLVAHRVLDDELAQLIEPVADVIVDRGDPRTVGIERADEAVQHVIGHETGSRSSQPSVLRSMGRKISV